MPASSPPPSPSPRSDTPLLPRVGCGAAILHADRLLLVLRRRNPEADHWGLPGGKLDPYETVADATIREIAEELGIAITLTRLLCVVDQIDRARSTHWVAPVFLAAIRDGAPAIQEPDALADWGWFPLTALPAPLTEATRQALAALTPGPLSRYRTAPPAPAAGYGRN
ncbi:ADP-ribose pyrophosphatase [Gluconacetobacter sacchari DSM 12717]|uniref:NUDIX domain-containing protein n=2 Tax=Gluconacetobacter sacchari TaxID=92759 RepID=A0A7W4I9K8_9PROT|nr:NUDIX domain-containing protein [Gluconacetobacter sacchari]MBB2158799.1 NUDIX domain-containing protein [Gluconacetobacter sacchari]GBQ23990.1 ADP-ribose pyrophosphatase [Gluconacetobacter sacchari DSM 12717]